MEETKKGLDYLREEARKAGFPGVHIQMITYGVPTPELDKQATLWEVDSYTQYNWGGPHPEDYIRWGTNAMARLEKWDNYKVPYCPNVSIGWDNTPRFPKVGKEDVIHYNNSPQSFANFLLKAKEISEEISQKIENLCNDEWKLLRQNESKPTVMLVKRSYFGKNKIQGILEILTDKKTDIGILAGQIMDYKYDNLSWKDDIPASEIDFITIPYSDFVVEHEGEKTEVILPTVHSEIGPEDGKVSFLVLLGSVFILLGVVVSIIMLY